LPFLTTVLIKKEKLDDDVERRETRGLRTVVVQTGILLVVLAALLVVLCVWLWRRSLS
jgi:uncharacterized membrane protein YdbT with pleckstrin-like domain